MIVASMADDLKRLQFLLDAPSDAGRSLQIAKLGAFNDPRYGDFSITSDEVEQWAKNLARLPGGVALIDFDHAADKPAAARRTEAAGWITAIRLEDGVPRADVEWTPAGEAAIRERRYLFFSPTYGTHKDETGAKHEDTLIGGALTNRPFLNMPMICLASVPAGEGGPWHPGAYQLATFTQAERDRLAASGAAMPDGGFPIRNRSDLQNAIRAIGRARDQAAARAHIVKRARALGLTDLLPDGWGASASDSRRQMAARDLDTTKLLKALGLADDADEAKILEAIEALRAPEGPDVAKLAKALGVSDDADEAKLLEAIGELREKGTSPDAKTLEQQARAAGFVMLTTAQAEALNSAASEVVTLKRDLRTLQDEKVEETFKLAWERAVDELRAAPAEEEAVRALYDANPDATLKMLEARPKIANDTRHGAGGNSRGDHTAPRGVLPDQWELDQKVQAYIAEHPGTDYMKALAAVEGTHFGATA